MILFSKKYNHYLKNKRVFFLGFLTLTFLFLPFFTHAWVERLINAVVNLPILIIAGLLLVNVLATQALAFAMGLILDWVISPGFISYSYTAPGRNPIIELGLNITQPFVNLILVVILVYIALSIALRIGEYDAKKLFPRLIVVALLVNFTPVLCGLIVDASNIVMNYFLTPIQDGVSGVLNQVAPLAKGVWAQLKNLGGEISTNLGLVTMVLAQIFLNLCIALVFFLFAALFIFRYIALWVIVILSPIAFAFWILPRTRLYEIWNMWWNQFIQWSIIGIPMAFFLYLGLSSFSAIQGAFVADLGAPIGETASGALDQMFPFFVTIVFLFLGFLIGLSTSAMGAAAIIRGGKAAGKVAGLKTLRATGRGLRKAGREFASQYSTARKGTPGTPGVGRIRAFGRATGRTAQKGGIAAWASLRHPFARPVPGVSPPGVVRAIGRGSWNTLRDMALAAYAAGVKKPPKGKGKAFCGTCGASVSATANFCPSCGATL